MGNLPILLSSIICGRCKTSLSHRFEVNGIEKYTCDCSLKIRVLLDCLYCKKRFLNFPYLIRKTNYCSLECYRVSTNRKKSKICVVCKKKFAIKSYLVKQGFGFYCSKKCWFSLFNEWKREVKCEYCKKTFKVIRAVYKKKPRYCSKEYKDASQIDHIFRICRVCNGEFKLTQSALDRGGGSFCARECYIKYRGESSLEMIIRQQLQNLNETFEQEKRFGKFRADFYLPKRNLIIECDGEYWHTTQQIKLRDQRKNKLLQKMGYNILRLTGQEIISRNFVLKDLLIMTKEST